MVQRFIRLAKRLALFLPGILIAYLSVRYTYPLFDRKLRLGDIVSILVTYLLAAYILIPAVIRLWRIVWPTDHLPLYCITPDGFASDPLNVGLIGTRRQVINAMEKAGWYRADPHTPPYLLKHVLSIILGWSYVTAPVSSLYLFGRKQDLAFEIPAGGTSVRRHHVRFWATTFIDAEPLSIKKIHWHNRRAHIYDDKLLWVGSASLDIGVMPIRHNLQLTHMIHPDTNQERELIVSQLKAQKLLSKTRQVKLGNPYRLINRTWRGELHTDGKMTIAFLKPIKLSG